MFVIKIRLRSRPVEIDDGSSVLSVDTSLKQASRRQVLLRGSQGPALASCNSTKLRDTAQISILPELFLSVEVNSRQNCLQVIQPLASLYEKCQLALSYGIDFISLDVPFQILAANYGKYTRV